MCGMYARLRVVSRSPPLAGRVRSGVLGCDPADPSIVCALRPHFGIAACGRTKGRNHAKAARVIAVATFMRVIIANVHPRLTEGRRETPRQGGWMRPFSLRRDSDTHRLRQRARRG